jgi:hypothetical protein
MEQMEEEGGNDVVKRKRNNDRLTRIDCTRSIIENK